MAVDSVPVGAFRVVMKELSRKEIQALRGRGHKLKPVVLVGHEGLTDAVYKAADAALLRHELIKVKLLQNCAEDKDDAAIALSKKLKAVLVQRVGRTTLLWRERPEEKKKKPKAAPKTSKRAAKKTQSR